MSKPFKVIQLEAVLESFPIDVSRDTALWLTIGKSIKGIMGMNDRGIQLWEQVTMPEMRDECSQAYRDLRCRTKIIDYVNAMLPYTADMQDRGDYDGFVITTLDDLINAIESMDNVANILELFGYDTDDIEDDEWKEISEIEFTSAQLKKKCNDGDNTLYAHTIFTLANMLRKSNTEAYNAWIGKYVNATTYYMSEAKFGDMTQTEFIYKWHKRGVHTDNWEDMAMFKADITKWLALLTTGSHQYIVNDDTISIETRSSMSRTMSAILFRDLDYKEPEKRGRGRPRKDEGMVVLGSVVQGMCGDDSFCYGGVDFTIGTPRANRLNMFRGFVAQPEYGATSSSHINVIYKHILGVFANGNVEYAKYIVQWLARLFFDPEKVGVALFLIGEQGCGKTSFWELVVKYLLGEDIAMCIDTLEPITAKFNSSLMNTRLVLANEVKGCDMRSYQRLKSLVTDTTIGIEAKGVDMVQMRSIHAYVFLSNYAEQYFIEDKDRRFAVFQCSEGYGPSWWYTLDEAMDKGRHDILAWLKQEYDPEFNIKAIPMSELKASITADNRHPILHWLEDTGIYGEVDSNEVYPKYMEWCKRNGIDKVTPKRMMTRLSREHITTLGQRSSLNGGRSSWWKIDKVE